MQQSRHLSGKDVFLNGRPWIRSREKMSSLMDGLGFVRAYIDDLLILTKSSWADHLQKLAVVLDQLQQAGLKVNAKKSFFGRHALEYLGYWIKTGVQPTPKKVDALHALQPPTTTNAIYCTRMV